MAKTEHYYTKLECNQFYHVYNRSVDKKPMFKSDDNYLFFLKRYHEYLHSLIETYAYNLLGNHFHILLQIKSENEFDSFRKENKLNSDVEATEIVSRQFRKFFQSYAMAFNKQQNRTGTLFQTPFKRVLINNKKQLINTINYIHQNAQLHGLVDDFKNWKWSSYNSILSEQETHLQREKVLHSYNGKNDFIKQHIEKISGNDFDEIEF